jgi:hypothetical protein
MFRHYLAVLTTGWQHTTQKYDYKFTRYTLHIIQISDETDRIKHMNVAEDYKAISAYSVLIIYGPFNVTISIAETDIRLLKSLVHHKTCEWLEIKPIQHCLPIHQLYMARPACESVITCRPNST